MKVPNTLIKRHGSNMNVFHTFNLRFIYPGGKETKIAHLIDVYWLLITLIKQKQLREFFIKKVFLKISQKSQEKTCASASFLIKLQADAYNLLKRRRWYGCFPVNFVKFLRVPFSQNTFRRLLLLIESRVIYNFSIKSKSWK